MKKFISFVAAVSIFFSSQPAFSQSNQSDLPTVETPQGEVDPGLAISPMKILQKAPFSGLLLSPKVVANVMSKLKNAEQREKVAADEAKEIAQESCKHEKEQIQIKFDVDKTVLEAQVEYNKDLYKEVEKQLQSERSSQIPGGVWFTLGAVGGVAISVLSVFAIAQAVK